LENKAPAPRPPHEKFIPALPALTHLRQGR
jgi:hypothetical protein